MFFSFFVQHGGACIRGRWAPDYGFPFGHFQQLGCAQGAHTDVVMAVRGRTGHTSLINGMDGVATSAAADEVFVANALSSTRLI